MPAYAPVDVRLLRLSRADASGCRLWTGCIDRFGYGKFGWHTEGESLAHRAAYKIWVGPIPDGLEIDHLCRVRHCINPGHLHVVPHAVNVAASVRRPEMHRNTRKTHCKRGHPLSGGNLLLRAISGRQVRQCRACVSAAKKQSDRKLRAIRLAADPVGYRAAHAAERRAQRAKLRHDQEIAA